PALRALLSFFSFCLPAPPPASPALPLPTLFRSRPGRLLPHRARGRHLRQAHEPAVGRRLRRRPPPPDAVVRHRLPPAARRRAPLDRKSTRLNSSHQIISYAVFCLKKKNATTQTV